LSGVERSGCHNDILLRFLPASRRTESVEVDIKVARQQAETQNQCPSLSLWVRQLAKDLSYSSFNRFQVGNEPLSPAALYGRPAVVFMLLFDAESGNFDTIFERMNG
jgi:hypothetical protein